MGTRAEPEGLPERVTELTDLVIEKEIPPMALRAVL